MEEAQRLCDRLVIIDQGKILAQGSPRELINQYVEPEVLEFHGEVDKIKPLLDGIDVRTEMVGDTVYCYTADTVPVIDRFKQRHDVSLMQRPANLEDVFLRITGRELRD